jgi:hypothetical protein
VSRSSSPRVTGQGNVVPPPSLFRRAVTFSTAGASTNNQLQAPANITYTGNVQRCDASLKHWTKGIVLILSATKVLLSRAARERIVETPCVR